MFLTKSKIKELAKEHGFYLRKRMGQNFIIDRNLRDKIIRMIDPQENDVIVEIGPGLGALTGELAGKAGYVYAIEKDDKLYSLCKLHLTRHRNLKLIHGDFLDFDFDTLLFKGIKVVGALPYYITTPILQRLIDFRRRIDTACAIVQKEVARRIAARAGDDDYSSLSLFVQFYADIEFVMDIKKEAFFPQPEVDSALVRLKILPGPRLAVKDDKMLFKVIRQAFAQRRKTLLSALAHREELGLEKSRLARLLDAIGIDGRERAERLTLSQFAKISDSIA